MKGIVLAGGNGTRLYPSTIASSKQLLPVYDKPMIYYPVSVLMLAGISDILIISTPEDIDKYKKLLGNGKDLGLNFQYAVQPSPDGLAQAFIIGEHFISNEPVCLVLGDNIFYGNDLQKILKSAKKNLENNVATVFGYHVRDPERYGVVEFSASGKVMNIIEKPEHPKSSYAVTGLYFYPNDVIAKAKKIIPSDRGELEITSVNEEYLLESRLAVELMGRGFAWLDTGTHESLLEASFFIHTIEKRQSLKIACIEEIAYLNGFISLEKLTKLASNFKNNEYGKYLMKRIEEFSSNPEN